MGNNHKFCQLLFTDISSKLRKGMTATYSKIGSKKFYLVQSGSGHWNWEGVADCSWDAKVKAINFWKSIEGK
jgi:hypothetical protein